MTRILSPVARCQEFCVFGYQAMWIVNAYEFYLSCDLPSIVQCQKEDFAEDVNRCRNSNECQTTLCQSHFFDMLQCRIHFKWN
jgi:hypothetical protein